MTILRIRIGEQWPQVLRAPWVLLDESGRRMDAGEGEPADWPTATAGELLLSASQVSWLEASLPRLPRGERARALAYALEEQLVREPDSQHLTPLGPLQGAVGVLVIARERLRELLAPLADIGLPVLAAYSELQTAVTGRGAHLTLRADGAVLRTSGRPALALDLDGEHVPILLAPLLQQWAAGTEGEDSASLTVHAEPMAAAVPWLAGCGASLGETCAWYELPLDAANLLHGEFAPRRRHQDLLLRMRPAVWVLLSLLAADTMLAIGHWSWQRYRLVARQSDIAVVFASAFPKLPLVDAPAQARKQLDLARAGAGQLRSDDALALMADLADVLGSVRVRAAGFEAGRLDITVADSDALAGIEGRLGQRDIVAIRQTAAAGGVRLILRRGVSR